jgi:hypothetical protein
MQGIGGIHYDLSGQRCGYFRKKVRDSQVWQRQYDYFSKGSRFDVGAQGGPGQQCGQGFSFFGWISGAETDRVARLQAQVS